MNNETFLFNPLDLETSRSTFEMHPTRSGTMNAGRLYPVFAHDVMPGDEFTWDIDSLVKMSTPVYPTMDGLYMDVFAFYVPNRLVLGRRYGSPDVNDSSTSWAAIIGAQDNLLNMPIPADGVKLPVIYCDYPNYSSGLNPGCLLDYFDVDLDGIKSGAHKINCLPALSYFAIWNENFREPSTMSPVTWSFSSNGYGGNIFTPHGNVPLYATKAEVIATKTGTPSVDYLMVNALASSDDPTAGATAYAGAWLPFPVCRFHGYFGSALPWPQRNSQGVELPLGDMAPVLTASSALDGLSGNPLLMAKSDGTALNASVALATTPSGVQSYGNGVTGTTPLQPANLYADLSQATAANVNALRAAIAKQRWYEKLARSGNRYDELTFSLLGVRPHDSGDDRPKYLGGKRINLSMQLVASTNGGTSASSGEGSGSLGSLGAFSHTNDSDFNVHAGFDDWGTVMYVACIRHHDTFSSGTPKWLLKRSRDELYFPTMAHLGEQKIRFDELTDQADSGAFGYTEAWNEYRYIPDRVCGLLRSGESLDFMTYARKFGSGTDLATFLNASSQVATVDKTLAVSSNAAGFQFVYQFTFNIRARRPMPQYSIPGLMDHF